MEKSTDRTNAQVEEIAGICSRLGISRDELAGRVPMNPETLRKVAKGYQAASGRLMAQIRNVERMAAFWKESGDRPNVSKLSPFRLMELETLEKHFTEVSLKLRSAAWVERKHILGNLRAILDELDVREPATQPPAHAGKAQRTPSSELERAEEGASKLASEASRKRGGGRTP